jgi:hypothetical protein
VQRRQFFIPVRMSRISHTTFPRCRVNGKNGATSTCGKQRLVLPESVWRRRFHRRWSTHHTPERTKAKQGHERQHICQSNLGFGHHISSTF